MGQNSNQTGYGVVLTLTAGLALNRVNVGHWR